MTQSIGIVTVLYNSDEVLEGFFQSLGRLGARDFKLYVIDNSATDSGSRMSHRLADQYGIDCSIVFNRANLGVAEGNNIGIRMARADGCGYVALSNNDIEFFDADVLTKLKQRLLHEPRTGMVVPKIHFHGTDKLWYAGGSISPWRGTTRHLKYAEVDRGQVSSGFTGYAPTCFMLVRSEVFDTIGLMDATYFVYYDDTDFIYRACRAGFRLALVSETSIAHKVSHSTGGGESDFSIRFMIRNRIYFISKNLPAAQRYVALVYTVITRLLLHRNRLRLVTGSLAEGFKMAAQAGTPKIT